MQMSVHDLKNLVLLEERGFPPQNQLIRFPVGSVDNGSHNPTWSLVYLIFVVTSNLPCRLLEERVLVLASECLKFDW